MENEWIFDVLRDLRSFAEENELPEFAACVANAERVARGELEHHGEAYASILAKHGS